ncbi:MAG: ribonuclease H-like domain-containing protein [Desulfobulbaceae bacterium]|nr:ribonuclease H-like domain-containing protein [Desulfobulbaceae bacterium]
MLFNTFVHIPGIGEKTEKQIWQSGVLHWDQWHAPFPTTLSAKKIQLISSYLERFNAENDGTASYFAKLLQPRYHWRLFPHFHNRIAFFDIETNGLSGVECEITTIALYDGNSIKTYVQGKNLEDFIEAISHYEVIVTYNGKSFDVPVIESCLRMRLPQVHLDLRHILAGLGFKGGLKGCEKQLGINRMELDGVDGYSAVLLWQEYQRTGNLKALETLLAYNIADSINLEPLLILAYNLHVASTPFHETHTIDLPIPPAPPCSPDRNIVEKLIQGRLFHV